MPNEHEYDGAIDIPKLNKASACLEERNPDPAVGTRYIPINWMSTDGGEELRRGVYAGTQAIEMNREGMSISGQWWWENRRGTHYLCWRLERTKDRIHSMPLNPQVLKYRLDLASLLAAT